MEKVHKFMEIIKDEAINFSTKDISLSYTNKMTAVRFFNIAESVIQEKAIDKPYYGPPRRNVYPSRDFTITRFMLQISAQNFHELVKQTLTDQELNLKSVEYFNYRPPEKMEAYFRFIGAMMVEEYQNNEFLRYKF